MIYIQLVQNVALLVFLVVIHGQIIRRWNKFTLTSQVFSGFLFGCVALTGMMAPVHLIPGVIFDGRSIVLSVAGLFGGPITAGIAAIMSAVYRLWLGGSGALMGVSVIFESAGLGVAFFYLRRHYPVLTRNLYLFAFGLLVHLGMLLLMLALPREAMLKTLENIPIPVMLIYPAATWLICLLFLDQEARLSAENAVRESEARYRAVFENAAMGIDTLDRDGRITQVNPALSKMLGYTGDELKGRTFDEVTHPDDRQVSVQNLESLIKGEIDSYRLQKRYLRKNGEIVWGDVTTSSIKDANGSRNGVVAVIADTTERKQAETELRQSEEKFAKVFQYAPLLMTLTSVDEGMFLDVNDKFIEVSGFSRAESIGKTSAELGWFSAEDRMHLIEELQTHGSVRNKEIKLLTKDKREIVCVYNGELIQTKNRQMLLSIAEDVTDRRKTEEALLQSDARRRLAQDAAKAGTWEWDLRTNDNFWSEELWGLYGLGPHSCEPSYDAWRQTIHPDDRAMAERLVQEAAFKGAELSAEWRIQDNEGVVRWLMSRGRPVSDATGHVVRYIGICIDITERKRTEEQLRRSEEKYLSLFQDAPLMYVITWNEQGVPIISDCNKCFLSSLGFAQEEVIGKPLADFYSPESRAQLLEGGGYVRALAGEFVMGERQLIAHDGSMIQTLLYTSPERDHTGHVIGTRAMFVDITSARIAEETQRRLATAIEQATEGVIVTDTDGTIQHVNPAMCSITGYSREELLGSNTSILKSGEQDSIFYKHLWDTIKSGHIWNGRLINRKKDGRLYYEDSTISPVKDSSGKIVNFVGIKRDITEHMELSKQLLQAQKMEAIGTLAGGIAHDFNNLLQTVLGYSEFMLQRKKEGEPDYADLQKIYQAGKRGADLVKNLLTFSRRVDTHYLPIDLNQEITAVRGLLSRTIPKTININLHLSGNVEYIKADPSQICQVLMNLGVNARDAMPDGGTLTIETTGIQLDEKYCNTYPEAKPGNYVLLTISDTGQGMDNETLSHIFEPFFSTKEVGKGTGLGLATVYGIVKHHQGRIICYSELGHGTTFKIYLPAIQTKKELETTTLEKAIAGGTETVLLVDDDDDIRDLVATFLIEFGYSVITAVNGKEAVEMYQRERESISLVILDLVMPVMDGSQCLAQILRIDPKARVVIASGFSEGGTANGVMEAGAKGFVQKPYNMRQLLTTVREILDEDMPGPVNTGDRPETGP